MKKNEENLEQTLKNIIKKQILPFIGIALLIISSIYIFDYNTNNIKDVSYSEFINKIKNEEITKVEIKDNNLLGEINTKNDNVKKYIQTPFIENDEFIQLVLDKNIEIVKVDNDISIQDFLIALLKLIPSFILLYFIVIMFDKLINVNSISKNHNEIKDNTKVKNTFKDVAGQDEAIEQLKEIVDFLKEPQKYTKMGAKLPKGALLVGPPGTGKTLMAKALAGEANVPFYSISGSDFIELYAGVGAKRVRDLFHKAKENQPSIIFIDEIDAIGKSRSTNPNISSNNSEKDQTLNQLLTEMDGFNIEEQSVMVLAATNMPEILDKALLRPGRFDRQIIVNKPTLEGRIKTLEVATKKVPLANDVDLKQIALLTSGGTGADVTNIVNEATIAAVQQNKNVVNQQDLTDAIETVFTGKKLKDKLLNAKEKKLVSYHEIGHAIVAAELKKNIPIEKITIIPRTSGALGFTMQSPEGDKVLQTKDELLIEIQILLGGRAAEEYFFNVKSTGASDDIKKATNILKNMITTYGMSEDFGLVSFSEIYGQYMDQEEVDNLSQKTLYAIEEEVINVMKSLYNKVLLIMKNNATVIHESAKVLIEKETLTRNEFKDILLKHEKAKN